MRHFYIWYFVLTCFGLAALPLGWTWFRYLPDRGWGLFRPLGLILVSFTVWFLGSLGFLRLGAGSGMSGLLVLFGLGVWFLYRWGGGFSALYLWIRYHYVQLLIQEGLFFLLFAFWTWYRVHDSWGASYRATNGFRFPQCNSTRR